MLEGQGGVPLNVLSVNELRRPCAVKGEHVGKGSG